MDINSYQIKAEETAIYDKKYKILYPALGLAGEVGEVSGEVSKIFRDDKGELTPERREKLIKELGDCLWFLAQIATDLNVNLSTIAELNIEKLNSRAKRGVLNGSGGDR